MIHLLPLLITSADTTKVFNHQVTRSGAERDSERSTESRSTPCRHRLHRQDVASSDLYIIEPLDSPHRADTDDSRIEFQFNQCR